MSTEVGKLLGGRWRLVSPLGAGGQGHTYIARDEKAPGVGEHLVVVKHLSLGSAGWKRFDLFEREAKILARLDHSGIPRYLDRIDGDKGAFYLVMEHAPGESLRARGTLTELEARDVLRQVLDILIYLHTLEPPVVHRDIKPANLVRADNGRVRLVDFGGVKSVFGDEGGSTVIGTYGYMAPEQLHGEATPRTDLYGLGATIVTLLGGAEPDKVRRKGLKMDLDRHLPKLAGDLRALLDRMVDPDPDNRPASAAEARKLLGAIVPAAATAPAPAPVVEEEADDWVAELEELRLPAPIKLILRMAFGVVGIAGHVGLALVSMILVPLVFSVARIFTGKDRDARLVESEARTQAALRVTRRGFRALQRRAFAPRAPKLPPVPEVPRLPRKRR